MIRFFLNSFMQACRQIARNKPMLITSLFSVTAMMLILGFFCIFAVNISLLTQTAREQFDMAEVFLEDQLTEEHLERLRTQISELPCVERVEFVSKSDALQIMKQRWGDHGYLLDGLSDNPLPASFQVSLSDLSQSDRFVRHVKGLRGVEDVSCKQEDIDKMTGISNHVRNGMLAVILFLFLVSVVVVVNTVKLTVFARGREIRIMRYVGATSWFIRAPFLLEGILMGLMASAISLLIVFLLYHAFTENYSEKMMVMFSLHMVPASDLMGRIAAIFLVTGSLIGTMGSLISMRKYLKV